MRKKVFFIIMTITIVLTGCQKTANTTTNNVLEVVNSKEEIIETETPSTNEDTTEDLLIYTYKDNSKAVAFDYPNAQVIDEAYCDVFKTTYEYYIAYTYGDGVHNLEDVIDILMPTFASTTTVHNVVGTAKEFVIAEQEKININDTDILQIEGSLIVENDFGTQYTLPMKGYVFCKDGGCSQLIGVVTEEDDGTFYNEMTMYLDAMIKTLRDDR